MAEISDFHFRVYRSTVRPSFLAGYASSSLRTPPIASIIVVGEVGNDLHKITEKLGLSKCRLDVAECHLVCSAGSSDICLVL